MADGSEHPLCRRAAGAVEDVEQVRRQALVHHKAAGRADMHAVALQPIVDGAVALVDRGTDPGLAVAWMFDHVMKQLKAIDARFVALEARRSAAHGRDVVGILDASINGAGHLVIEFSDGSRKDVGLVVGAAAEPAPMGVVPMGVV
jgi:hypothetical protein